MKRRKLPLVALAVATAAGLAGISSAVIDMPASDTTTLSASSYYTWGISPQDVAIPDGYIITEAIIALHGLTSTTESRTDKLVVYLLDNPPTGWHENTDIPGVDHFAPHGCRLPPVYTDRVQGCETLAFRASTIENPDSWAWRIHDRPFSFKLADGDSVKFSSTLLELVDYIGNATPFGIGLDPADAGDFSLGGLSLTLTIQAFQGLPNKTQLRFAHGNTNNPPILFAPALRVVYEGQPLQVDFLALDPDGEPVNLSYDVLPPGAVCENGLFSWTPSYTVAAHGSAAPFVITLTADDGLLSTSRTFAIWVFDTNRPPRLINLTQVAAEDIKARLFYRIDAVDPDGDPVAFEAVQLPPGAGFDPETRIVTWDITAVAAGAYDVTLTVSDGLAKDTRTFSVNTTGMDRSTQTDRQENLRLR